MPDIHQSENAAGHSSNNILPLGRLFLHPQSGGSISPVKPAKQSTPLQVQMQPQLSGGRSRSRGSAMSRGSMAGAGGHGTFGHGERFAIKSKARQNELQHIALKAQEDLRKAKEALRASAHEDLAASRAASRERARRRRTMDSAGNVQRSVQPPQVPRHSRGGPPRSVSVGKQRSFGGNVSQTARSPHGSALNALSGLRPQRHDAPTPRSARSSRDSATVLEQQNDALRKENEEVIYLMTRLQEENKRLSATVAETKQQLDEHKANRKLQEDHMAQLMQQAIKKRAQASSSAGQEQPSRYTSTEADPGTGPALDPLVTINSGYGRALRVRTNLEEVALELESWIEHFQAVIAVVAEVVTPQPHARALHQQQQQQQAAEDEAAEYDSHQGGRGGRGSYLQSGRVDAGRSSGNVRHLATWQAMSKAFRREMDEQLERIAGSVDSIQEHCTVIDTYGGSWCRAPLASIQLALNKLQHWGAIAPTLARRTTSSVGAHSARSPLQLAYSWLVDCVKLLAGAMGMFHGLLAVLDPDTLAQTETLLRLESGEQRPGPHDGPVMEDEDDQALSSGGEFDTDSDGEGEKLEGPVVHPLTPDDDSEGSVDDIGPTTMGSAMNMRDARLAIQRLQIGQARESPAEAGVTTSPRRTRPPAAERTGESKAVASDSPSRWADEDSDADANTGWVE